MKIILISDTHGKHHLLDLLPEADMIIHAGDISSRGTEQQVLQFLAWYDDLPYKHKIFIAGNHDFLFQTDPVRAKELLLEFPGITYLEESSVEIEGFKIFGTPWTPYFYNWAFNYRNPEPHISKIPTDTNILITHGPAYGIRDKVENLHHNPEYNVGCRGLLEKISGLPDLKLHVFGHIHCSRGQFYNHHATFINAAVLDDNYQLQPSPIFEIEL